MSSRLEKRMLNAGLRGYGPDTSLVQISLCRDNLHNELNTRRYTSNTHGNHVDLNTHQHGTEQHTIRTSRLLVYVPSPAVLSSARRIKNKKMIQVLR
jgi:hypothetical protein